MLLESAGVRQLDIFSIDKITKEIIENGWIDSYPIVYRDKNQDNKIVVTEGFHRVTIMRELKKKFPERFGNIKIKCVVINPVEKKAAKSIGNGFIYLFVLFSLYFLFEINSTKYKN